MSKVRTHATRLGAAVLASAAALGAGAAAAGATSSGSTGGSGSATPATLSGIQAKAAADITQRVNDLNGAIAKVNAAKGLGSGQATLDAYLSADIVPLQALGQKIAGDTTVTQAAQDFSTIFTGYRVYLLVLPAARIAGDADRVTTTAVPALTADAAKAQAHVNPGNQAVLQPLIDDLNSQVSAASGATSGQAATVLAYTPAQWNANNDLLASAKSSDQAADAAIQKARNDVQQIRQDGKGSGRGAASSAVTTTTA